MKHGLDILPTSRHRWTTLYRLDGTLQWGLRRRVQMKPGDRYILHIVQGTDDSVERLDSISFQYYGTSHWAWVLADINQAFKPWDLVPGQTLRIPTKDTLASLVGKPGGLDA